MWNRAKQVNETKGGNKELERIVVYNNLNFWRIYKILDNQDFREL